MVEKYGMFRRGFGHLDLLWMQLTVIRFNYITCRNKQVMIVRIAIVAIHYVANQSDFIRIEFRVWTLRDVIFLLQLQYK